MENLDKIAYKPICLQIGAGLLKNGKHTVAIAVEVCSVIPVHPK